VRADLGFSRTNLAGVRLPAPAQTGSPADFYARVREAVRSVPAVSDVALLSGSSVPLSSGGSTGVRLTPPAGGAPVTADFRRVSRDYFETAKIPVIEGRTFASGDDDTAVGIIDELAARRLFEGRSPVGLRLEPLGLTVIGVVANVKLLGPEGLAQAQVYRMLNDTDKVGRVLLVRTSTPIDTAVPAIQAALAPLMANRRPPRVDVVEDQFRLLTADRRFNAAVMTALGLLALLIAASGIYATTAGMVAQRTKEIGIRMALGASAGRVIRVVTGTTAKLLLTGAVIGLAGAWAASGVLESVVFGISATSPAVYLVPLALVAIGGCLAALVPAMRAARVDPLVTLRAE
jgi:ABC-type antimicrobial peptide transport system permease subunit